MIATIHKERVGQCNKRKRIDHCLAQNICFFCRETSKCMFRISPHTLSVCCIFVSDLRGSRIYWIISLKPGDVGNALTQSWRIVLTKYLQNLAAACTLDDLVLLCTHATHVLKHSQAMGRISHQCCPLFDGH